MPEKFSIRSRRCGVIIMFSCVIMLFFFFLLGEYGNWKDYLILGAVVSGIIGWFSFQLTLKTTGLWKMCRRKAQNLDEREKTVVLNSYRLSYLIFGVVSVFMVFLIVLSVRYNLIILTHRGHFSFGLAIVLFLDFLVSMLPPSILAWTEPVVEK